MGFSTTWTQEEDFILADSWLFISHDPIKSNQQSGETFWERIFAVFSSKLAKRYGEKAASTRTVTAVQNRWSTMNHDLNKFAGVLSQVKAVLKSGYNEEDYLTDAMATYRTDSGKPFRFLRAFERVKDDPKWKTDGGLMRDKKAVKKAEAGKQAKRARKALTEISVDANAGEEVVIDNEEEEQTKETDDEKPERPIGIKAAKAALKVEKKEAYSQLQVDRQIAEAQRGKAEAAQTQARTLRDEFLLKLIAFNPAAAEAKEWMALKIAEAVTEAKEMKLKKERELEQMEEEMARLKKAEDQKKTLKPARFVRTPKDVEKEDLVEPALTAVSTNSNSASSSDNSRSFTSTISTNLSTTIAGEVQQHQQSINLCCAGDYCYVSNGHKIVCGMTCRRCRQSCHFDCCEDDEYGFKICASCEKERACDEEV